jgi:cell division initiation protein
MMTPQEVLERKFKPVMMGGYETASVDLFLEQVTEDYSALYKENAVLKSKLKVLAERVEEYRTVDTAMRQALLAAQKMAAEMVADAKTQADDILKQAQQSAAVMQQELQAHAHLEEKRLETARKQTITFVNGLRELYTRQMEMLAAIPTLDIPDSRKVVKDKRTAAAVTEIDRHIEKAQELPFGVEETPPPPAPPPPPPAEEPEEEEIHPTQRLSPTPRQLGLNVQPHELEDDEFTGSFAPVRDPEDTEVPPPRTKAPDDIDKFFGHPH